MKCPKCNYVSFDNLTSCKKCGFVFKETGTKPLTFPEIARKSGSKEPPDVSETVNAIRESLDEINSDTPSVTGGAAEDRTGKSVDKVIQLRDEDTSIEGENKFSGANTINWDESISLDSDELNLGFGELEADEDKEGKVFKLEDRKQEVPDSLSEQLKGKLEKIGEELKQLEEEPASVEPLYQPEVPDTGFDPTTVKKGGFWIRLLAYFMDGILLNVISFILVVIGVIALGLGPAGVEGLEDLENQGLFGFILSLYIFMFIINSAYYTCFHGSTGQTLGKMVCSLKVVRYNGEPLGYGKAFLRWLGYIPSSVFLLGFLWVAWDKNKQGWHDKIAQTYVIKK